MAQRKVDSMPLSNERGTPQWVATSREGVQRYFRDLKRVMAKYQVTDDAERKEAALIYVPIDVAKRWESLPTYSDAAKTYSDFRDQVLSFYLGSDKDHKFTLREFDDVVSSRVRTGINSLSEYMAFYGEFYPIARYLMEKTHPELTQRQVVDTMLRLLHDNRRPAVEARLNQKVPDKHREDSYTVEQVHEAISHVIDNQAAFVGAAYREVPRAESPPPQRRDPPPHIPLAIAPAPAAPGDVTLKAEVLQQVIAAAIRTAREDDARANANRAPPLQPANYNRFPDGPPRYPPGAPRGGVLFGGGNIRGPGRPACFYCGQETCSIATCPIVEADVREGLVVRDRPGGHVLLANGREIPGRRGAGVTVREAMLAYYDQNPDRRPQRGGAAVNMVTVHLNLIGRRSEHTIEEQIEAQEQQAALLQEVKARRDRQGGNRNQRFDAVEITTRPPRGRSPGPKPAEKALPQPPAARTDEQRVSTPPPQEQPREGRRTADDLPIHPYSNAADATKAGAPPSRGFAYPASQQSGALQPDQVPNAAKPAQSAMKGREPAYRTQPAGLDPDAEDRVFQRNFVESKSIVLSPIELLSLSPALCKRVHHATGNKRVTFEGTLTAPVSVNSVSIEDVDDEDHYAVDGSRYVQPTVESYQLHEVEGPERPPTTNIVVGAVTHKLRAIAAWVNNTALVECVLDGGSQIVAISAEKAYELGISYDPTAKVPMQSANGAVNETKGLARNVSLQLKGGIVVYLQMHVVENASYDILLGRPFEVLVGSRANSENDSRQEIVVTCPNTGETLTIPMYARGEAPSTQVDRSAGF